MIAKLYNSGQHCWCNRSTVVQMKTIVKPYLLLTAGGFFGLQLYMYLLSKYFTYSLNEQLITCLLIQFHFRKVKEQPSLPCGSSYSAYNNSLKEGRRQQTVYRLLNQTENTHRVSIDNRPNIIQILFELADGDTFGTYSIKNGSVIVKTPKKDTTNLLLSIYLNKGDIVITSVVSPLPNGYQIFSHRASSSSKQKQN